jgi:uncharacterized metal-binding protein YceD (DUF177 family)
VKVRISTIPPEGIAINATVALDSLNARMNEGRDNDISFTNAPYITCIIKLIGGGAELSGNVCATVLQPCSLCSKLIEREIEAPLNFVLRPGSTDNSDHLDGSYLDDVGMVFYENDYLDLENLAQESLILSLSPFWRPSEDCNGACAVCGKQLNKIADVKKETRQSFAQLLKAAGITANEN